MKCKICENLSYCQIYVGVHKIEEHHEHCACGTYGKNLSFRPKPLEEICEVLSVQS